jgi:hypothetical protein
MIYRVNWIAVSDVWNYKPFRALESRIHSLEQIKKKGIIKIKIIR